MNFDVSPNNNSSRQEPKGIKKDYKVMLRRVGNCALK